MTALLFLLEPERVRIAMDTCSTHIQDNGDVTPGPFCSKMFLLPHLGAVVCGAGHHSLVHCWIAFVQQNAVARDITELDNIARAKLPRLAEECGVTEEVTSTIYHFGYALAEEQMLGLAYRSTTGFQSERLVYGFGVKPPDAIDLEQAIACIEEMGLPDGFVEVMKLQKAHHDSQPPKERVGIGGEVQFLMLEPRRYSLSTCHRFDDYDCHFEAVRARTVTP